MAKGSEFSPTAGEYAADQLVFSAGAWNIGFLSKLKLPLRLERQVLFWFEPAGSSRVVPPREQPEPLLGVVAGQGFLLPAGLWGWR